MLYCAPEPVECRLRQMISVAHPPTRGRAAHATIMTIEYVVVNGANKNVKIDFDAGL
jgi:hypothetical protein